MSTAHNPAAALDQLQTRYQIVFSDILMPGQMSGLDLARSLRAKYGSKLLVLLATGYSEQAQVTTREEFSTLRKPYNQAELREAIAKATRNSQISLAT